MEEKVFSLFIDVRVSDIGRGEHVNNAVFYTYFEEGLKHFLRKIPAADGWLYLIARSECDYRSPINFEDRPHLCVAVDRLGNSSVTVKYTLADADGGKLFAEGKTVLVGFDYGTRKTAPLTPELKAALQEYVQG